MVSAGTPVYTCEYGSCKGGGYSWSQSELDDALASDVGALVRDDPGTQECLDIFTNGATTNFSMDMLKSLFNVDDNVIKDWQVGEGIACAYLHDHRSCDIPWCNQRDLRTPSGSLPGVDICGIRTDNGSDQLFVCEVKTSTEQAYPPQVASANPHHGGLAAQVKDLRDNELLQRTIIRYLVCRAKEEPWRTRIRCAVGRYLTRNSDIGIYGFMVRDVTPDKKDLEKRVKDVSADTNGTDIEFLALYLPLGKIATLATSIRRTGGGVVC